jgi:tetratricopeptide (TPR) repeat protein
MKRGLAVGVLAALLVAVLYGIAVTRRDAEYRILIERGDAALARDDSFAAIDAFTLAQNLKSDSMAAYLKRGEAYRRRNELDAAQRDLKRATQLDPVAPLPHELLGDVYYGIALADPDFGSARFLPAVAQYSESARLDDASSRVQYKLGLALYQAGQLANARPALRRAITLNGRFAEAHYLLGVCLRASQQPREAIEALKRAVELSTAFLPAREELADLYLHLERFDDALEQLEVLRSLQPPSSARERQIGLGYASAGQVDRAVAHLGHTARRYPDDAETFIALGRFWLSRAGSTGRIEIGKALEALERGVRQESSSEALTLLGRAQLLAGQVTKAEGTFQLATTRFPIDPQAFLHLSNVAARRGRTDVSDRAMLDYAALTRFEFVDVRTLLRIAEANLRVHRVSEVHRAVGAVLAKEPGNQAAEALLARAAR